MSVDELMSLFRSELKSDVGLLKQMISGKDLSGLKAFAHKYKVRLQYLEYLESYELCLKVEQSYESEKNQDVMDASCLLLEKLDAINNNMDECKY